MDRKAYVAAFLTLLVLLSVFFTSLRVTVLDVTRIQPLRSGSQLNTFETHSMVDYMRYVTPSDLGSFHHLVDEVREQEEFRERIASVQTERQQRLAEGCRSLAARIANGIDKPLPNTTTILYNVPSPLRLTYCAVPKCSTTTWFNFFTRVTDRKCRQGVEEFTCASSAFESPSSIDEFQPISLVVVRDPWRRLVSTYMDKFVTERHEMAASCYKRHGKNIRGNISLTFAEFVSCILEEFRKGLELHDHYAPQSSQCWLCKVNYSYIAKLETLADDFRYLATYVFPKRNYTAYRAIFSTGRRRPVELHNATSTAYEDCYGSLTAEEIAGLMRVYRPDAELFGYKLQPLV